MTADGTEHEVLAQVSWETISHLFMTSAGRFEGIAEDLGLAASDLGALLTLDPDATPSQGELAREWMCDASWVTAKVDSLEQLGLVARVPDLVDRRRKTVALTTHGRTRQTEALQRVYDPPQQIRQLSVTDLRALARILAKLDVPNYREKGPPRGAANTFARAAKTARARDARNNSR